MKESQTVTMEVIKASEVNPETSECIRVFLLKSSPTLFVLMMEGYPTPTSTEMSQLGSAKTFRKESEAIIQFDYLVHCLSVAWMN